ncbi:MAG: sulfatase [Planctomycetota bacterium]
MRLILTLHLLVCFIAGGQYANAGSTTPNVVFVLIDDLGWRDLGCYGSEFYDTPNIDQLADQGTRFTDAYACCHVCSPSRAAVLTGKYPARLMLTDWLTGRREFAFQKLKNARILQALPLSETTLAEALKARGYATAHFGKWHLGEDPAGPTAQGFDVQKPRHWFKGWPRAGYHAPFKFDDISEESGDYLTDRLTDEAIEFIENHRDKPFFLYLSHFAVHDPIQGRRDLVEKYESRRDGLPEDVNPFVLEGNPDSSNPTSVTKRADLIQSERYGGFRVLPRQMVKIKQRQDNPQFAAMVESVDESVGRVMDKLRSLGIDDHTIVIFTSDNGGMSAANFGRPSRIIRRDQLDAAYSTSNLPLRGAKGWLYEGGIRVPLIIKWPGQQTAGSVCREPVIGTDYYPTILEMIGAPAMPKQHADGQSLVGVLRGETLDRALYWHFPHYSNHGMQSPGGAIRDGKHKLLEYFENGTVELFDLDADPGESRNLAGSNPELAERMLRKLRAWRETVSAQMMPANPAYDPNAGYDRPALPRD